MGTSEGDDVRIKPGDFDDLDTDPGLYTGDPFPMGGHENMTDIAAPTGFPPLDTPAPAPSRTVGQWWAETHELAHATTLAQQELADRVSAKIVEMVEAEQDPCKLCTFLIAVLHETLPSLPLSEVTRDLLAKCLGIAQEELLLFLHRQGQTKTTAP